MQFEDSPNQSRNRQILLTFSVASTHRNTPSGDDVMSDSIDFTAEPNDADLAGSPVQQKKAPTFDSYVLNGRLHSLRPANVECEIYKVDNFVWQICN